MMVHYRVRGGCIFMIGVMTCRFFMRNCRRMSRARDERESKNQAEEHLRHVCPHSHGINYEQSFHRLI